MFKLFSKSGPDATRSLQIEKTIKRIRSGSFYKNLEEMKQEAEHVKNDIGYQEKLFQMIEDSKENESMAQAASTAITLLNFAGVSLSGKKFQKIKIPNAILDHAICYRTNFSGACLRNVSFNKAIITEADMSQSDLEGAEFGVYPMISLQSKVLAVAYSLDGKTLAISDDSHPVVQWFEIESGRLIHSFFGHQSLVTEICFTTTGKLVSADEHTLRIFDTINREQVYMISTNDKIISVAASWTDEKVAYVTEAGELTILDLDFDDEYQSRALAIGKNSNHLAFSLDGKSIYFYTGMESISICDIGGSDGIFSRSKPMPGDKTDIQISRDGRLYGIVFSKEQVHVFETKTDQLIFGFSLKTNSIEFIRFFDNDTRLAVIGNDALVRIYDINSLRKGESEPTPIQCYRMRNDSVRRVQFSSDASSFAYISEQHCVEFVKIPKTIHLNKSTEIRTIREVSFSHDGKRLLAKHLVGNQGFVLDTNRDNHSSTQNVPTESVCFSPDALSYVQWSYQTPMISLHDIFSGKQLFSLQTEHQDKPITAACFSKNGKWLATGSGNSEYSPNIIEVTDLRNFKIVDTVEIKCGVITKIISSNDSSKLLLSGSDHSLMVYDIGSRQFVFKNIFPETFLEQINFSNDGKYIVCISENETPQGTLLIWDIEDHHLFFPSDPEKQTTLKNIICSFDCHCFIGIRDAKEIEFRHLKTGELLGALSLMSEGVMLPIDQMVISPHQPLLAAVCFDGSVHLIDVIQKKEVFQLKTNPSKITALQFSQDGNHLVVCHQNQTIWMWDITKKPIHLEWVEGTYEWTAYGVVIESSLRLSISGWTALKQLGAQGECASIVQSSLQTAQKERVVFASSGGGNTEFELEKTSGKAGPAFS